MTSCQWPLAVPGLAPRRVQMMFVPQAHCFSYPARTSDGTYVVPSYEYVLVSTYVSTLVCMECTYDAALYSNTVCKYVPRLSSQEHQAYQLLALNRWNIKVNILKPYETEG